VGENLLVEASAAWIDDLSMVVEISRGTWV